jgi:hypothetical protein
MHTRNTARRVLPMRETVRRSAKPRTKKPTPSFPTADQLEQVIAQLRTLVSSGEEGAMTNAPSSRNLTHFEFAAAVGDDVMRAPGAARDIHNDRTNSATGKRNQMLDLNQALESYDDGWADTAAEAADILIRGTLLKFSDWHWSTRDGASVPDGTRFLATGTNAAWVKLKDKKIVERIVRKSGVRLPDRCELDEKDQKLWPLGLNGKDLDDPWKLSAYVHLVGENAEAFTFATWSGGGRSAVNDLADTITRMRRVRPGAVPMVELHAAPMRTQFGKKSKPLLKIIEWQFPTAGELKQIAAPATAETALPQQRIAPPLREEAPPWEQSGDPGYDPANFTKMDDVPW